MVDALILAGGRLETGRFPDLDPNLPGKTAVPLLGKPMVHWVARALRGCPAIYRIAVVGPCALDTPDLAALGATVVPERDGICENLRVGLDALPGAGKILGVSGDLPLLTHAAIADFLANAPDADIVFPYVEREDIVRDFPDRTWIYANTPDGQLTGCSVFLGRAEVMLARWAWVEKLLGARRRSVLGLALLVGPSAAIRYACGRLRVSDVEARMSALLRLTARGYRTRYPVMAMDVDKSDDIPLAEGILRKE